MPCVDPSVNTIDRVSCETEASVSGEKWVPWLRVGRCQLGAFACPCAEAAVGTRGWNWTVECSDESLLLFWDSAAGLCKSVTPRHCEGETELRLIICHLSVPPALCCPVLLGLWRSCSLQLGQSSWSQGSSSGCAIWKDVGNRLLPNLQRAGWVKRFVGWRKMLFLVCPLNV